MTSSTGRRSPPPRPAPLAGTRPLGPRTIGQLTVLTIRHLSSTDWTVVAIYAAHVTGTLGIVSHTVHQPIPWWAYPLITLGVAIAALTIGRWLVLLRLTLFSWVVGYFDHNTMLLASPRRGRWVLSDHITKHPGQGEASDFRESVFGHLAAQADLHQVAIYIETLTPKLAQIYSRDLPGLRLLAIRRDWLGRTVHMLLREPAGSKQP